VPDEAGAGAAGAGAAGAGAEGDKAGAEAGEAGAEAGAGAAGALPEPEAERTKPERAEPGRPADLGIHVPRQMLRMMTTET
jgi:hypothetical protein